MCRRPDVAVSPAECILTEARPFTLPPVAFSHTSAAAAVRSVPAASEAERAFLDRAVRRLVEAVDPERVLLFGSRAKGTAAAGSDVDLCVIADLEGSRRERRNHLRTLLRDVKDGPMDVLTYTPAEFARERHLLNSVTYFIDKHGRTLYRKNDLPENNMEEPSTQEHDDWVRRWFEKADRDLETVRRTLEDDPMPDVACYHAQQAAEKCLKGFLTARGREIEKTHVLPTCSTNAHRWTTRSRSYATPARRSKATPSRSATPMIPMSRTPRRPTLPSTPPSASARSSVSD